jgi:hypothetical protein
MKFLPNFNIWAGFREDTFPNLGTVSMILILRIIRMSESVELKILYVD